MSEDRVEMWRPYVRHMRAKGWSDERIGARLQASGMKQAALRALLGTIPDSCAAASAQPTAEAPAAVAGAPRALSIGMTLVAIPAAIGSGLVVLGLIEASTTTSNEWGTMGLMIVLGLGLFCVPALVLSCFVWCGRNWARVAMIGLMAIIGAIGAPFVLPALIAAPVIYVLLREDVRQYCSR